MRPKFDAAVMFHVRDGTKKQSRESRGNNSSWERDDVATGDATSTATGTARPVKRARTNNGNRSNPMSRNTVVSSNHGEDNPSFIPTHNGHNNVMPDVTGQNDFSSLDNLGLRPSITWDDLIAGAEGETCTDLLQAGVGNLDFPSTFKGYPTPQNIAMDDVLPNTNPQPQFHASSESSSSVPAPGSSEEVTMGNKSISTNPMENVSFKASPGNTCNCLQKHAEVLGNPILSAIRACDGRDDGAWSMDKALSLVKHAMNAWQGLLTCPYCPYDDDQEVMLLTFMSIRGVTRYLQRLYPRYNNASQQGSGSESPQPATGEERLQIGSFELEGNDRMLVLRVLYQITLQKVKCILHSLQVIQNKKKRRLQDKTQNKPAGVDDYQASSNLFHIQQISHGLITSLQTLEMSPNGFKESGAMDPLGALQAPKDV
ncbi:hypothetical protein FQN54_003284 [Arachnomyces sp. PD_36]|nr:hypothetical protein FQN54_003284 [Arachnomyces sp. PD_36]